MLRVTVSHMYEDRGILATILLSVLTLNTSQPWFSLINFLLTSPCLSQPGLGYSVRSYGFYKVRRKIMTTPTF